METSRQRFDKSGYAHVPSVVGPEEVPALREQIEAIFSASPAPGGTLRRRLTAHEVLEHPELYRVPIAERVVSTLRDVLGPDYWMVCDLSVHRNLFGDRIRRWHADSFDERNHGYVLRRDYSFVNCGIYLQKNSSAYGGGISALPGGHRYRFRTFIESLDHRIQDRLTARAIPKHGIMLPIEAGDLVVFHSRLPHAATLPTEIPIPPGRGTAHIPVMPRPELNKYVLYFCATTKREFAERYLESSGRQAQLEVAPGYAHDLFFTDYLRLSYPTSFPRPFVEEAERLGVHVATLPPERARHWDELYRRQMARRARASVQPSQLE